MIKIININMPVKHNLEDVKNRISKILKVSRNNLEGFKILKKSIDARKKNNINIVYTVEFSIPNENKYINNKNILKSEKEVYINEKNIKKINNRPVIVGSGPAGLFCGIILAEAGLNPIILERGKNVLERSKDINDFIKNRNLNEESNIQFGEGGAGTFSDGKLTTNTKDKRICKVIDEFLQGGAPEEIGYLSKPHIGSDNLIKALINIRKKIENLGGEFRFSNKLVDLKLEDNILDSLEILDENNKTYYLKTDYLVLALGHSARDTFSMLKNNNMTIKQKSFAIGMRIEHKQIEINKSQYGKFYNDLDPAEYKLNHHTKNNRGVFTFCMCPGGVVVPATSTKNQIVTNGMSSFKRDKENANSALLIGVSPEDFDKDNVFSGIDFQIELEKKAFELGGKNYNAPVQLLGDFLQEKPSISLGNVEPSYKPGYTLTDLSNAFNKEFLSSFKESILFLDKKLKGFNTYDAILTGFETRSSSPITLIRNENFESSIKKVFVCGEGSGYAGGIMTAGVDGIKCGENIIKIINE